MQWGCKDGEKDLIEAAPLPASECPPDPYAQSPLPTNTIWVMFTFAFICPFHLCLHLWPWDKNVRTHGLFGGWRTPVRDWKREEEKERWPLRLVKLKLQWVTILYAQWGMKSFSRPKLNILLPSRCPSQDNVHLLVQCQLFQVLQ